MRFLLDMNLSPALANLIASHGHDVLHWSEVGDHRATDLAILKWAREHQRVVVTHDLDFAALLAEAEAVGPSVIQVREQDLLAVETAVVGTSSSDVRATDPRRIPSRAGNRQFAVSVNKRDPPRAPPTHRASQGRSLQSYCCSRYP